MAYILIDTYGVFDDYPEDCWESTEIVGLYSTIEKAYNAYLKYVASLKVLKCEERKIGFQFEITEMRVFSVDGCEHHISILKKEIDKDEVE